MSSHDPPASKIGCCRLLAPTAHVHNCGSRHARSHLADSAELFHTATGTAYADLAIDGHRETWPVRSPRFRAWLRRRYYEATGDALSAAALNAALNLLEARAQFDGPERTVHVRVAEHEGRIYLDLADQAWRAVDIGPDGWRVVAEPPVRFRRPAGLLPLPIPQRGGSLGELRSFLNLPGEDDLVLVAAWLLATLRHGGPYPLLVISGEQGSAKTVLSKMLRALVDPNAAPVRTLPREERDLFIAANNGHVLAFDNVSALPAWLSDTLCRLASGGSFAVRRLYTDEDEVLFDAARPVILNGIEDVITRPDLADRALFLTLPSISEPDAGRRQSFGGSSSSPVPACWGRCLMLPATVCRCCPTFVSNGCRGWPTSPVGRRHAKPRCGLPARSRAPTRPTAGLQSRMPSTPTRWPPACASSWPSAAPGGAAPPTCCVSAPIAATTASRGVAPAGPKIPARLPAACAARRRSCERSASRLPSAVKAAPEAG